MNPVSQGRSTHLSISMEGHHLKLLGNISCHLLIFVPIVASYYPDDVVMSLTSVNRLLIE